MEEFNVMEHQMVPSHYLLSEEEAEKLLKSLKITRDQLPKIRTTDPVMRILERIEGEIPVGSVIKVVRKSITAGETANYRLVIEK